MEVRCENRCGDRKIRIMGRETGEEDKGNKGRETDKCRYRGSSSSNRRRGKRRRRRSRTRTRVIRRTTSIKKDTTRRERRK